jgi:hypothetical protein
LQNLPLDDSSIHQFSAIATRSNLSVNKEDDNDEISSDSDDEVIITRSTFIKRPSVLPASHNYSVRQLRQTDHPHYSTENNRSVVGNPSDDNINNNSSSSSSSSSSSNHQYTYRQVVTLNNGDRNVHQKKEGVHHHTTSNIINKKITAEAPPLIIQTPTSMRRKVNDGEFPPLTLSPPVQLPLVSAVQQQSEEGRNSHSNSSSIPSMEQEVAAVTHSQTYPLILKSLMYLYSRSQCCYKNTTPP